ATGVTIILTTHYIEEAEAIADRVGVISKGQILLVQDKAEMMSQMGQKQLRVDLAEPATAIPASLSDYDLTLEKDGTVLVYTYDTRKERTGIRRLLNQMNDAGLVMTDLQTQQSSLEDIFVGLVKDNA
ncbi:MAG: multidrug ABC transporter ATP-binding protein, partial [Alphaproteobacteria bacterium]|nr:multidrug ABC transporter ATP-binding protein [Alphaproteobacteria bacterium]